MVSPNVELGVAALVGRECNVSDMRSEEQHERVQPASEADGGCDTQQNPVPVPNESRFGMLEERLMSSVSLINKVNGRGQERQDDEEILLRYNPEDNHAELVQEIEEKVGEDGQRRGVD